MAPTANALMSSPPMKPAGSIASRWRELQGARSWAGLLDPLDDDLRRSVINYGELAQAAYDGFNLERRSPHAGSCLYSRAGLLTSSTVLHPERYTVTKFLYATSGQSPASRSQPQLTDALFVRPLQEGTLESNWMGYVAVATDEGVAALGRRDIVVAWRGTATPPEWGNDFDYTLTSAAPILGPSAAENYPDAQVHHGFLSVYTSSDKDSPFNKSSARNQVLEEVKRLMELHKDEVTSITVTGHSLGASLATLTAVDIVANGVNVPPATSKQPPCPVAAILLASPRVGNDNFKTAFASFHHLRALHVKNARDIVPNLPPKEFGYVAAATATLPIDTDRSPYLLPVHICGILDIGIHDLECYLHGVAGDNGADKEFDFLVVQRDVALVNKWADALKYDYPVPASWWVVSNKCMVIKDGHWELDDFKEI